MPGALAQNVVQMTPRRDDEPTPALLRQMVIDIDDKHQAAHKRLREDVRTLETDAERTSIAIEALKREIVALKTTKPDATELRFPLPLVATIIIGFFGIGASIWSMNSTLKDELAGLKQEFKSSREVQGQQLDNLKETIQRLDRQQQLQYAEFQTFRQEMARRSKE